MPTVENTIVTVTGNVALAVAEASVVGSSGFVLSPVSGGASGRTSPFALAFAFLPSITGLQTAASVSLTLRAGTSASAAQFGGATAGIGAQDISLLALGLVPVGTQNVFVGALVSSSTATANASAAVPILCGALYLD